MTIPRSRIFIAPHATATTVHELSGIKIAVSNGESRPVTASVKPTALYTNDNKNAANQGDVGNISLTFDHFSCKSRECPQKARTASLASESLTLRQL